MSAPTFDARRSVLTDAINPPSHRAMIAVLSPAKTFATLSVEIPQTTEPHFARDAAKLARAAAKLSPDTLQSLMHISPALGAMNATRYKSFGKQDARPAIAAFDGDVYRGLDAPTLSPAALVFADGHLRFLSGLYGLLRPTDAIRPYRLEMGTGWAPNADDLYGFWKRRLAARLEAELEAEGSGVVLNLASKEYWQALGPRLRKSVRVVTVDFRDAGPRGLRFNTFVAKKARGAMARLMCERGATDPGELHDFDYAGHSFDEAASDADTLHFVRRT